MKKTGKRISLVLIALLLVGLLTACQEGKEAYESKIAELEAKNKELEIRIAELEGKNKGSENQPKALQESKGLAYIVDQENGSVTIVGRGLCTSTDIVIPETLEGRPVTAFQISAFRNDLDLHSITIPDSIISIRENAFFGCSNLTGVYIADLTAWCGISFGGSTANPLYYAHYLYLNGKLVTDLVVPDSVTKIGNSAFSSCWRLKSITIPYNVTSIGSSAFYDCSHLTSITYQGTKAQWDKVSKGYNWNSDTGSYTITCVDGTISK